MFDRLVTTNEWYKLRNLGLCTIENDGVILFTQKAKRKYPDLKNRLYDLNWVGSPEGQTFCVPKFTADHIQKIIGNYGDNMIVLTKYSFVKFWKELKKSDNFKDIKL